MSQHRKDTRGPSGLYVLAATMGGTLGLSSWILLGAETTREYAGVFLGLVAATICVSRLVQDVRDTRQDTVPGVNTRAGREARLQAERDAAELREARRAQAKKIEARLKLTGTWVGESPGEVLTVRVDPVTSAMYVMGWVGEFSRVYPEREVLDPRDLIATLREIEVAGELEPVDDAGTRYIRTQLGLTSQVQVPVVRPDPADTVVLTAPDGALRIPEFASQAEREAWAREHDVPTEFLPVHPSERL